MGKSGDEVDEANKRVPFPNIPRQVQPEDDHDPESVIPYEVLQRVSEQARARGFAKRSGTSQVPAAGVDRIAPSKTSYSAPLVGQPLAQIPEDSKLTNEDWDEDDEDDDDLDDDEAYRGGFTRDEDDDEEEEDHEHADHLDNESDQVSDEQDESPASLDDADAFRSADEGKGEASKSSDEIAAEIEQAHATGFETATKGELMPSSNVAQKEAQIPPRGPPAKDGSATGKASASSKIPSRQLPGTPTGLRESKDLDLRDVQFLPSLSKRGNRMGYLGRQLVELHVIKLRDLPTTARFAEEYSSNLRWIAHEYLTPIYGVSKRKENLFVVATGFVEFTLQELLNTASEIPYPFVLRFAFQLCGVLMYLHQQKLAHFNIHAHTVFMDTAQPPNLRLLDTGIGRAYQGSPFAVGNHNILVAPELHSEAMRRRKDGEALDGGPIDVFHFAFVLWEMLTGVNAASVTSKMKDKSKLRAQETASRGPSSKISGRSSAMSSETDSVEGERLHREIEENTRPPLLGVPPEFRPLLAQCWANDPAQRPRVADLAQRIKKLILATRQQFEPVRFFSPQEGLASANLPLCTPAAVRSRRRARMLGKERLKLQVNLCVLQDIASTAAVSSTAEVVRSDIFEGPGLAFRKQNAVDLRTLEIWRIEPLLRADSIDSSGNSRGLHHDKASQVVHHCRELRERFAKCPGLCMPHSFRRAAPQSAGSPESSAGKGSVLLDYVNGVSLQDILDRGGCVEPHFLARVAWGVLQGLGWLHRFGQSHGALCPRNILLDRAGNVLLSGLHVSPSATAVRMEEIWREETTEIGFVAPEVLLGNARDPRGDIWSLGMCLWACASGQAPLTHITTFEQAREYAASYSMTPNLDQDVVTQAFRKFVGRCILSLREERPRCDDLLLDDFLHEYVDYQPFSVERGDGTLVLMDPDEGKLHDDPTDMETPISKARANNRLERLIVRHEVAVLTSCVKQASLDGQVPTAEAKVDRFAHQLTSLSPDHVRRLLATLWGPGLTNAPAYNNVEVDMTRVHAEAENLLQELSQRDLSAKQPAGASEVEAKPSSVMESAIMELTWHVALVTGQVPGKSSPSDWEVYLSKILWRQGIIGLSAEALAERGLLGVMLQTRVPRVVVLDADSDGLEILFDLSAALKEDADLFVLSARPNEHMHDAKGEKISRAGFAEVVLGRLALMYVLLARQGAIILHEQGDPVLYSIASFGRKREPHRTFETRYDVFVGCPFESDGDAQTASQVIVSWLATKPSELLLAWARHDDAENVSHFLERLVTLELTSSVLFYAFPSDARAYSGMVRAIAHAVCGKPVVVVFGPLPSEGDEGSEQASTADVRRARELFLKHLEPLIGDTVHIFDTAAMDEAIEMAISISTLQDSSLLASLEAPLEAGSSTDSTDGAKSTAASEGTDVTVHARTDAFSSTVQKLVETWDHARVLKDLGDAALQGDSTWSMPQGLHNELNMAAQLVQRTLSAVSGVAVGSEPPSFADPNLEVAVQALPSAFDRSSSSLSSSSSASGPSAVSGPDER
ncbi:Protein kinase, putative [Hondaea fermentalgiana]|uniref:Protein kinase, putative n=1 Tax=Hondaea fermentalgiana TaxID=2315210 RepID=A0A2R5G551_9STRA|nr:Protein kinase, putative [Hondaea fermentalgiana]|eukprot:GBG26156.1 Protein kinase, putative [Hondaea fermentalgiana]